MPVQGCAGLFAFSIVAFFIIWFFMPSCNDEEIDTDNYVKTSYSAIDAYFIAQECVKEKLVSPASADFPHISEITVDEINDSTFYIKGYLDSQNSFGAMLRSKYSCQIRFNITTGKVAIGELVIE